MRLSTGCVARHENVIRPKKVDLDWLFQSQPLPGVFELVASTSTCSCRLSKGMVDLKWYVSRSQISPNRPEKVPEIVILLLLFDCFYFSNCPGENFSLLSPFNSHLIKPGKILAGYCLDIEKLNEFNTELQSPLQVRYFPIHCFKRNWKRN